MTKEQIIIMIVVALISTFCKSIFDNLVGKYMPDKNKLNSYIKNVFLFSIRYLTPLYFLIFAFIDDKIDKFFIFKVSIFTSVLFFNILFDLCSLILESLKEQSLLNKSNLALNSRIADIVISMFNQMVKDQDFTHENFLHIMKVLDKLSPVTEKLDKKKPQQ